MFFNGLYGPLVQHVQIDYCPSYGIIVNDTTVKTVFKSSFDHLYFESVQAGPFFFSAAVGVTVNSALTDGTGKAYDGVVIGGAAPRWRVTNDSRVGGVWLGGGSAGTDDAIEPIGGALCRMDVTQSANQSTFAVRGPLQLVEDIGTIVAGTAINPTRVHHRFDLAGHVTMTATPSMVIPPAASGAGRVQILTNNSPFNLTLQDIGTLPGSGMKLGTATRVILPGRSMFLLLGADNYWKYMLTTEEGAETLASGIVSHQCGFGTPATDNSGTAGATTINKCNGRAAIATGASTVTVTNSSVAAVDTVVITALGRDATCTNLVVDSVSDGSFIVSGAANATADTKFMFAVIKAT